MIKGKTITNIFKIFYFYPFDFAQGKPFNLTLPIVPPLCKGGARGGRFLLYPFVLIKYICCIYSYIISFFDQLSAQFKYNPRCAAVSPCGVKIWDDMENVHAVQSENFQFPIIFCSIIII